MSVGTAACCNRSWQPGGDVEHCAWFGAASTLVYVQARRDSEKRCTTSQYEARDLKRLTAMTESVPKHVRQKCCWASTTDLMEIPSTNAVSFDFNGPTACPSDVDICFLRKECLFAHSMNTRRKIKPAESKRQANWRAQACSTMRY